MRVGISHQGVGDGLLGAPTMVLSVLEADPRGVLAVQVLAQLLPDDRGVEEALEGQSVAGHLAPDVRQLEGAALDMVRSGTTAHS